MGHHHNPIILLKTKIEDKNVLREFIEHFSKILGEDEKRKISEDNRGAVYLRLDKQEAFLGYISWGQADPIRIKIKLQKSRNI